MAAAPRGPLELPPAANGGGSLENGRIRRGTAAGQQNVVDGSDTPLARVHPQTPLGAREEPTLEPLWTKL